MMSTLCQEPSQQNILPDSSMSTGSYSVLWHSSMFFTSNAFLLIAHLLLLIILVRIRRNGFQYGVFICVIVPCSYLFSAPSTLFLSKNMIQRNKAEILFICCFRIMNYIFLISQLYCTMSLFLSSGVQILLLLHFLSWACWSRLAIPTGRRIIRRITSSQSFWVIEQSDIKIVIHRW